MTESYEENMQKVEDLRAIVRDPNQPDPEPEVIYAAVQRLHQTRGVAKKASAAKKVAPIADLGSLFD